MADAAQDRPGLDRRQALTEERTVPDRGRSSAARIALVTRHADPRFMPLAALYLKSALVDHGAGSADDISILELGPDATAQELAAAIVGACPAVLALSCYVWNVVDLLQAAALARRQRPSMRVVAGGPEVGPLGRSMLARHPALDVVVKGEGEGPIVELVDRWRTGRAIDDVAGIWRRGTDGPVEHPDAAATDLDRAPSPHARRYVDATRRIVCVETQRGCVYRCGFCYYSKDLPLRRVPLPRVKTELLFWLEQDISELYLMDPVFNLVAARAKEICRFLIAHNRRRIPLHAEIRAELVDDELAALMRQARFGLLEVGLQTTSSTALEAVDRRVGQRAFLEGVQHLRAHGLPFELQLILGLPGDTPESYRESLNVAAALQPEYLASFPLMVLPGTELWRRAEQHQLVFDREPWHLVSSTPTMSDDFLARHQALSPWVRLLWNSGAVRWLAGRRGVTFAELLDAWGSFCDRLGAAEDQEQLDEQLDDFVRAQCAERGLCADARRGYTRAELQGCVEMLRRVRRPEDP